MVFKKLCPFHRKIYGQIPRTIALAVAKKLLFLFAKARAGALYYFIKLFPMLII